MGFEEPQDTARLVFEGDYAGAEVVCRLNVPLGTYFAIGKSQSGGNDAAEEALRLLGDNVLVAWNVERNGQPVPANGDGMMQISPRFATLILGEWLKVAAEVPAPLDDRSTSGVPYPAQSIPAAALSGSPSS